MVENKFFLRIDNEVHGFVLEGLHEIKEDDIAITNEDHTRYLELQSKGKQFKIKEIPTGNTLFDYVEEYTPQATEKPVSEIELLKEEILIQSETMVDLDFRLTTLELGL